MKTTSISRRLHYAALVMLAATPFALLSSKDEHTLPKVKFDRSAIAEEFRATTFAPVVAKVSPSVVNIHTTKAIRSSHDLAPLLQDPAFRQFFFGGREPELREREEQNLGSGVIATEDGYILTNNHVVEGAAEIKVSLADNRTVYNAKLVGTDPQTDIALLKVDAKDLPSITIADSEQTRVGDVVLAIGNPFGIGQTVTSGIISAKGRSGIGIVDYEDFIQTDASINPGNSGGALVDASGRLVGICTAILSRTGGNHGVGFAVPSNLARFVMERLVADGKVTRGHLGVVLQSLTPELTKEFGLPENAGALVGDVTPGSAAEKAGIRPGDVFTAFDGKKVMDNRHLRLLVGQAQQGSPITAIVLRDGEEKTLTVRLAAQADGGLSRNRAFTPEPGLSPKEGHPLRGLAIDNIESKHRQLYGIPSSIQQGVVVVEVASGSTAAMAGVKPGDVILEINREAIATAEEAIRLSQGIEGNKVLMRLWSSGSSRYVVLGQ